MKNVLSGVAWRLSRPAAHNTRRNRLSTRLPKQSDRSVRRKGVIGELLEAVHYQHLRRQGGPARRSHGIEPTPGRARKMRQPFPTMAPNRPNQIFPPMGEPYPGARVSTSLWCQTFQIMSPGKGQQNDPTTPRRVPSACCYLQALILLDFSSDDARRRGFGNPHRLRVLRQSLRTPGSTDIPARFHNPNRSFADLQSARATRRPAVAT